MRDKTLPLSARWEGVRIGCHRTLEFSLDLAAFSTFGDGALTSDELHRGSLKRLSAHASESPQRYKGHGPYLR